MYKSLNKDKDKQQTINKWCNFQDLKTSIFFKQSIKRYSIHQAIFSITLNALSILLVKLIVKTYNQEQLIASLALTIIQLLVSLKFTRIGINLNHLIDFMIAYSFLSFSRENETDFLFKQSLLLGILFMKSILFCFHWSQYLLIVTIKYFIIIGSRWLIIKDYNYHKIVISITILIFYQLMTIIIIGTYQYLYKKLWIKYENSKKSVQFIEMLIHQLPIGIILFDQQGNVIMQNVLSELYLPKDVDLLSKQYSTQIPTYDNLLLKSSDLQKFIEQFNLVLQSETVHQLNCAMECHPIPMKIILVRKIWNKTKVVITIITECSDQEELLYEKITQTQEIVKLIQLSDFIKNDRNSIFQALIPLSSQLTYYKKDSTICKIKNYLQFANDYIHYSAVMPFQLVINESLPDIIQLDIIKFHSILTQLIIYLKQQYDNTQQQQAVILSSKFITPDSNQKIIKDTMIQLMLLNVDYDKNASNIHIKLTVDFNKQLCAQDMILSNFESDKLDQLDYRLDVLKSTSILRSQFMHIVHQIFSIGGTFKFLEKPDTLIVQLQYPIQVVTEYQDALCLFDSYGFVQKDNIITQQTNKADGHRIKSSTFLVTSNSRIPQIKKDELKMQTSLSEFSRMGYFNMTLVSINTNQKKQEEQKQQLNFNSPGLSPIINSKADTNIDLDSRINTKMHHIEKAVSKTLQQILSEIMNYKGKKLNIHLKSARGKQRSFESSPKMKRDDNLPRNLSVPSSQLRSSEVKQSEIKDSVQNIRKNVQGSLFLKNMRETLEYKPIINKNEQEEKSSQNEIKFPENGKGDIHEQNTKSPQFQQRQVTLNDIETSTPQLQQQQIQEQPINQNLKKELSIDYKMYYNETLTFLLIDDSSFIQMQMSGMKFSVPKKFQSATKAEKVTELVTQMISQNKIFHFILLKLKMPTKDGFAILNEIRAIESKGNLPKHYIIATDNDFTEESKQEALDKGFDECLDKPFKPDKFEELIQKRLHDL